MERTKLKLTVILILAILDAVLLALVLIHDGQSAGYEEGGRTQAVRYLAQNGLTVAEDAVPWESALTPPKSDGVSWEIQTARSAETLLVDLVRGLDGLDPRPTAIRSIAEEWTTVRQGDRGVLTPTWVLETDAGLLTLDCATGAVSQSEP